MASSEFLERESHPPLNNAVNKRAGSGQPIGDRPVSSGLARRSPRNGREMHRTLHRVKHGDLGTKPEHNRLSKLLGHQREG